MRISDWSSDVCSSDLIIAVSEEHGIDFEAEIAVITDDVPMNVTADAARKHIRLLMLVNDVSLRNLIPDELAKGFGFFQAKPSSAFAPCAITPDGLGAARATSDARRVGHERSSTCRARWRPVT